jgi:hypothetical protein
VTEVKGTDDDDRVDGAVVSSLVLGPVIPVRSRTEDWGSAPLSFSLWATMSITAPRQWSGRTEVSLS